SWRSDPRDDAHSLFKGTIGDVQIYSRQLGETDMATLAEAVDPALGMSARMAQKMADLMPGFEQMHHASDTFKEIAGEYGVTEHGHLMRPLDMKRGGTGANTMNGSDKNDGLDGNKGNDTLDGKAGDDVLQGGYGNDILRGSGGDDILDGGHGEDRLI
ncbi:calcium-binding protein, partial [Tropicimonas aquimaris]